MRGRQVKPAHDKRYIYDHLILPMGGCLEEGRAKASLSEDKSFEMFREQQNFGPAELHKVDTSKKKRH